MEPCAVVPLIGRRVRSLQSLDLFPVKAFFFESGYEDFEPQVAVDCFELETSEPVNLVACSLLVVDHLKKKDNTLLVFFLIELGRVLAGLLKGLLVRLGAMPMRKK
jgi:hypothetical protein